VKGKTLKNLIICVLICVLAIAFSSGCTTDADVASRNLSKDAEQFKIFRRIVFVNGITDNYIMSIEGRCSVEFYTEKFEVTCKTESGQYLKHYLGRADNVFPFVEQLKPEDVSASHYKVIFKPSVIVPDVDLK
jgi:hypothetical protein